MRAFVSAALCMSTLAHASPSGPTDDDHALPCRPTIACTADIIHPGQFEFELGYLYRRLGNSGNQHSVPFLLKLTVAEWLQVQLGSNGPTFVAAPSTVRFFDNIGLVVKAHFHDQTRFVPSLSFSFSLAFPTAAASGYARAYDALFIAYVTKDFGRVHADLNVGYNVYGLAGPELSQGWAALAWSLELPKKFTPMVEGYYFSDAAPLAPTDAGVLLAIAYNVRSWFVIDLGADIGLIERNREVSAFVGVTILPVSLWRPARANKPAASR